MVGALETARRWLGQAVLNAGHHLEALVKQHAGGDEPPPEGAPLWSDPNLPIYRVRPGFSSATVFTMISTLDSIGDQYSVLVLDLTEAFEPYLNTRLIGAAIHILQSRKICVLVAGASETLKRSLVESGIRPDTAFLNSLADAVRVARLHTWPLGASSGFQRARIGNPHA